MPGGTGEQNLLQLSCRKRPAQQTQRLDVVRLQPQCLPQCHKDPWIASDLKSARLCRVLGSDLAGQQVDDRLLLGHDLGPHRFAPTTALAAHCTTDTVLSDQAVVAGLPEIKLNDRRQARIPAVELARQAIKHREKRRGCHLPYCSFPAN
jgi:hypothetical protein